MKMKSILMLSIAFLLSGTIFSIASAEEIRVVDVQGNATSSNDKDSDKNNDENKSNNDDNFNAESHRSSVASYVKSLLKIANREGGIGKQVREVAQSQNDSANTSEDVIIRMEEMGMIKAFLFGNDSKNLRKLKKEVVKTENDIDRLNSLLTQNLNTADKTELTASIKALENAQLKLNTFILEYENSFSLFGWFIRPFEN